MSPRNNYVQSDGTNRNKVELMPLGNAVDLISAVRSVINGPGYKLDLVKCQTPTATSTVVGQTTKMKSSRLNSLISHFLI